MKKQDDRPYRNFTLNEDFYDLVNDGVYFNTESLYKLVKKQDYYTERLKELEYGISVAEEHTEIIEETQIETTQEMEIAM